MRVLKAVFLTSVLGLAVAAGTLSFGQAAAEAGAAAQKVTPPTPNPAAVEPQQQPAQPAQQPAAAEPAQQPAAAQPAQAAQPGPAAASAQAPEGGPAPLRVMVGKSLLINTTERLKRVSVTDPNVADA